MQGLPEPGRAITPAPFPPEENMNDPRSEYDYGTAAIMLMNTQPARVPFDPFDNANATSVKRYVKIMRYHTANQDRAAYVKAARWVFRKYPQHFSVMR
jgi:hypothetical protein